MKYVFIMALALPLTASAFCMLPNLTGSLAQNQILENLYRQCVQMEAAQQIQQQMQNRMEIQRQEQERQMEEQKRQMEEMQRKMQPNN